MYNTLNMDIKQATIKNLLEELENYQKRIFSGKTNIIEDAGKAIVAFLKLVAVWLGIIQCEANKQRDVKKSHKKEQKRIFMQERNFSFSNFITQFCGRTY